MSAEPKVAFQGVVARSEFDSSDKRSDLGTCVLSFKHLDQIMVDSYGRFHPKMPVSPSGNIERSEVRELEKIGKITLNLREKEQMNDLVNILAFTSSETVRATIHRFFNDSLTNQIAAFFDGEQPTAAFSLLVSEVDTVLPFFKHDDQVILLQGLAKLPLALSPGGVLEKMQGKRPEFGAYQDAVKACVAVVKKCKETNFDAGDLMMFVKSVLGNTVQVAKQITMSKRDRGMKKSGSKDKLKKGRSTHAHGENADTDARYVGVVLPFVAELEPLMDEENEDADLVKLLQQFWVTCVLFANFVQGAFDEWSDAMDTVVAIMPPLFQKGPKIDFAPVKIRITELLASMLDPTESASFKSGLVAEFAKMLPSVPVKVFEQMNVIDCVFALSIYLLEMTRAERGIVDQIFDYTEVKYSKELSIILEAMLEPIFNAYKTFVSEERNIGLRYKSMAITIATLMEKFFSPVLRIQNVVDKYIALFTTMLPEGICCTKVLKVFVQNVRQISKLTEPRREIFNELVKGLISTAIRDVPYSFASVLFQVLSGKAKGMMDLEVPIVEVLDCLRDTEFRQRFASRLIARSVLLGQVNTMTLENIKAVENQSERLMLTAMYIVKNKENSLVDSLIVYGDIGSLLDAWTYVAMASTSLSRVMIGKCISAFLRSFKARRGIFAKTKNLEDIQFQVALLKFIMEQQSMNRHSTDVTSLFAVAFDCEFLADSCIVPALIHYASLVGLVLVSENNLCERMVYKLRRFMVKMCLLAVSYTNDDFVLKYITPNDITCLEKLSGLVEIVTEKHKESSSKKDQKKGLSRSESFSLSTRHPSLIGRRFAGSLSGKMTQSYQNSTNNFVKQYKKEVHVMSDVFRIINFLLCEQRQLFSLFVNQVQCPDRVSFPSGNLKPAIEYIWTIAPQVLYQFTQMPDIGKSLAPYLNELERKDMFTAATVPELTLLFVRFTPTSRGRRWKKLTADAQWSELRDKGLPIWKPLPAIKALALLKPEIMANKSAADYVAKCFSRFTLNEILLFLPQLVQSLRFDNLGVLRNFLIRYCKKSEVFCHYLLWNIACEKAHKIGKRDNLPEILESMEQEIIKNMDEQEKKNKDNEFGLIKSINTISEELLGLAIDVRPNRLLDRLNELSLVDGLYIPSNPNYRILSIDAEHSVPLKSHARVPVLIRFGVYDENDPSHTPIPFSCIFKIADDVRQDAMVIQFIDTFKRIFDEAGLDTWMLPYRVFATGDNEGVIECIRGATSRHDLGTATGEYLLQYFISKYGQVNTKAFQDAQANFIKSMAPYSLICYLFQVKDRHNANIMIDEEGHIIHIDFGFIFEISPGGNLKFERAPFRLTKEMIELMGGSKHDPAFIRFRNLLLQCLMAVRSRHEELESIAYLMMNAGFPCFRADSIKKLQQRFFLDKKTKEILAAVDDLIDSAYEATSTTVYDGFQMASNQIFF